MSRSTIGSAQNLFVRSDEFDNASWVKDVTTVPTVTANQIANPIDGSVNADLFIEGTGIGVHRLYQGVFTLRNDRVYTFSVFMKDNNRRYGMLSIDSITDIAVVLDLQTGTITNSTYNTSNFADVFYDVKSYGDGWYRIWATMYPKKTLLSYIAIALGNSSSVTGINHNSEGKSIYLWRAQFVEANWPGEPLQTTSSSVSTPIRSITQTRQNLANYSESIASFTTTNLTTSSNSTTNPFDGTTTASTLIDDATLGVHWAYNTLTTFRAGEPITISAAFKNIDRRYAGVGTDTGPGNTVAIADLQTGVISTTLSSSNVTDVSSGIEQITGYSGWYHVWITFTPKVSISSYNIVYLSSTGSSVIYSGNGSSVYFTGLQCVRSNWPGPYVKTTGTAYNPRQTIRSKIKSRTAISSRSTIA